MRTFPIWRVFELITELDEYYPTRTEAGILRAHALDIAKHAGPDAVLIEFGAGAGIKTQMLLEVMEHPSAYMPVDIGGDFLTLTAKRMATRYPVLTVIPVVADFTADFHLLSPLPDKGRRVALFPRSTIGNLDERQAIDLLSRMRKHVGPRGRAVIGVDLIKDVNTLIRAYDNAPGVTAAFNLDMLKRINRELARSLPTDAFVHEARWNARVRAIEMRLRCVRDAEASVAGMIFRFKACEGIHTESSKKYDLARIDALASAAGWQRAQPWTNPRKYFAVVGLA